MSDISEQGIVKSATSRPARGSSLASSIIDTCPNLQPKLRNVGGEIAQVLMKI